MPTSIELNILPPLIKHNKGKKRWLSLPCKANLYCATIVVSGEDNILREHIYLAAFNSICNNNFLPYQDKIYSWQQGEALAPSCIYFISSVIKSKHKLLNVDCVLNNVKKDSDYILLSEKLSSLIPETSTLNYTTSIMLQMLNILIQHLGNVSHVPLGIVVNGLAPFEGYINKPQDNAINLYTKNVDFIYDLKII